MPSRIHSRASAAPPLPDVGTTGTWPKPGDGEPCASDPPSLSPSVTVGEPVVEAAAPQGSIVAGRYVIAESLGRGAMGAVYAAYDSELHRRVALKFMRGRLTGANADEWRARLMREATAMARLSHANVVTLYDVGASSQDGVFLAMQLVEGGTLADWLKAGKRSWREVVSMLCDAGEGLAAAHQAGLIHRDFKPQNVLLGRDGKPRVTDFGLARSADESPGAVAAESARPPSGAAAASLARLTLTGSIMGTPGYMAPEQYKGNIQIDARADVFAFCATLYRALYGERPFRGEGFEQIAQATLRGEVSKPPKGSKVPGWLRSAALSGLVTDREARPASMEALLAVLRRGAARQPSRWIAPGMASAAICAAALGLYAYGTHREAQAGGNGPAPTAQIPSAAPPRPGDPSAVAIPATAPPPVAATASEPPPKPADARIVTVRRSSGAPPPALRAGAAQARAAAPSPPVCRIETNYDADGAPHFKKICQ